MDLPRRELEPVISREGIEWFRERHLHNRTNITAKIDVDFRGYA
jgi:hypothetical protein